MGLLFNTVSSSVTTINKDLKYSSFGVPPEVVKVSGAPVNSVFALNPNFFWIFTSAGNKFSAVVLLILWTLYERIRILFQMSDRPPVHLSPSEIVLLKQHFRKSQKSLIREDASYTFFSLWVFSLSDQSTVVARRKKDPFFSREYLVSFNLLGRQEFFKRFRVIFEEKKNLLILE